MSKARYTTGPRIVSPSVHGPALWLEADYGLPAVGQPVPQWSDKSGNGRHALQANAARQPIVALNGPNGEAVVTHDITDDFLVSLFAIPQPVHIFAIAKRQADTLQLNPSFWDGAAGGNTCRMYAGGAAPGSNVTLTMFDGVTLLNAAADKRMWHRFDCRYNGTDSRFRVDDSQANFGGAAGAPAAPNGFQLNTFGGGAPAGCMGASFAAFIVFPRILTALEIGQMDAYLKHKWGVF